MPKIANVRYLQKLAVARALNPLHLLHFPQNGGPNMAGDMALPGLAADTGLILLCGEFASGAASKVPVKPHLTVLWRVVEQDIRCPRVISPFEW